MSEKIDEVAKAIRDECQKHGYLVSISGGVYLWGNLARVAIATMRKPTPEMVRAGDAEAENDGEPVELIWQAMIDEMLK